jgi:hypothetical protein
VRGAWRHALFVQGIFDAGVVFLAGHYVRSSAGDIRPAEVLIAVVFAGLAAVSVYASRQTAKTVWSLRTWLPVICLNGTAFVIYGALRVENVLVGLMLACVTHLIFALTFPTGLARATERA